MKKLSTLRLILISYLEIICILFSINIGCYASNVSFSPILFRNEMYSSRRAHNLYSDSRGYLWVGTLDGLLRYNGTEFKSFTRSDLHTESSAISCIYEDSKGNIWIGTEGGMCVYMVGQNKFCRVDTPESNEVKIDAKVGCIQEDKDGNIWFSLKSKGIWSYNPESREFRNYLYDPASDTPSPKINAFVIDGKGSFIISVYCQGLLLCRNNFSSIENISVPGFDFSDDNFPQLLIDERNCVLATSANYGLCEIFPYTSKANVLIPLDLAVHSTGLCMDSSGTIFMSTTKGLYSLDLQANQRSCYDLSNTSGLPTDYFYCVDVDDKGGVIVGLRTGNLFYSTLQNDCIRRFDRLYDGHPLSNCEVTKFSEDRDGNVWVLTTKDGIIKYDIRKESLSRVAFRGIPYECSDLLCLDDKMWLSAGASLYVVDLHTGHTLKYSAESLDASSLKDRSVYPIFNSTEGLLFGTALGIITYDKKTREFGHLPGLEECNVNYVFQDGDTLLISTYAHGLVRYDLKHREVIKSSRDKELLNVTGRRINGVLKDEQGRIWVATNESGLVVVKPDDSFFVLDSKNTFGALKSDNIKSIGIDFSGTIWATTENGLTSISSDLTSFYHYAEKDGLLNNCFSLRSSFVSSNGTLFFGSRDGFVTLRADLAKKEDKRHMPKLYIDELWVNNESVDITSRIDLEHNRNSLTFVFSRPSLPSSSDGYVLCKMEGFDREWVRLGPDMKFICREMPSGKFKLQARSYSNGGVLESQHKPIEIVIHPPFYRSAIAIVLYVICFLGGLAFVSVKFARKLKKEQEERFRRFTEEKLALTPERKMLRAAQIGQSPASFLREDLSESERVFISKMDAVIEKHISDEDLSYATVAEQLCIGKQSLNLKVKSVLGITVNNYILLCRLFASVPLLSKDDSRVNVVCFKVGFNTPSYFAKCFKNAFGMLPGEFKEM